MIEPRYSVWWLARALGITRWQLEYVANHAASYYHPFLRGARLIEPSIGALAEIQKRIKIVLLQPILFPDSFHGGIQHRSPLTNASKHLHKNCIVKIDLRKHFPNVSSARVYDIWTRFFGFGPEIARLLTILTTYNGHLPQGTRTSSHLANLALMDSEPLVAEIAQRLGLDNTYFVDDVFASGGRAREALGPIISVMRQAGFKVGRKKTAVMGANGPQIIAGLGVDREKASVPQAASEKIRCAIHELRMHLQAGEPTEQLERSIRGRIAHVKRTNPGTAARLLRKLSCPMAPVAQQDKAPVS
jgi:hypothetical protein